MPRGLRSLLSGRNKNPLDEREVLRVYNTFKGLDPKVIVKYLKSESTKFRVIDPDGPEEEDYGEIIFGPDIYPGQGISANSSLSMRAAAAHELSHYYRWKDKREIEKGELDELDEALTSLEAASRFQKDLDLQEVIQLIEDAIARIQLYHAKVE